jgi:hypothetical protein
MTEFSTPPIGEILVVKQEYSTFASLHTMRKDDLTIFVGSSFVDTFGPYRVKKFSADIHSEHYLWKFIYNGEIMTVNWYTTLPIPAISNDNIIKNNWENYWRVLPKEEYKNYAL